MRIRKTISTVIGVTEKTIPGLMTPAIEPVAEFYTALGFEITFQQKAPYGFLSVRRGGIELNFYADKTFDPASSTHGVLVMTDQVDALYREFRAQLSTAFGKVPLQGIPRVGTLQDTTYGLRQFVITDPGGNTLQISQEISEDQNHQKPPKETFARAIHMGSLFADSKQDLELAVKVLDRALARTDEQPTPPQLVRLLVLRADAAIRQHNTALASELLNRVATVNLSPAERDQVADSLRRATELAL